MLPFYKSQNDVYFNYEGISNTIYLPKINQVIPNSRDCDSPATKHITTVYKYLQLTTTVFVSTFSGKE